MSDETKDLNERRLQKILKQIISDPSRVWRTTSGKRLQILSAGQLNVHEGPDLLEMGLLLDGMVIVGDGEFHKKSSDWQNHKHSDDQRYKNVILHIVIEHNSLQKQEFETLVIPEEEFQTADSYSNQHRSAEEILKSAEDLQHFALIRMLRKASSAQNCLNKYPLNTAVSKFAEEYVVAYSNKRRRPLYNDDGLDALLKSIDKSSVMEFLKLLADRKQVSIPDSMMKLIRTKIAGEGNAFRLELIINSVLPLALCLADDESRVNLFLWFWSTPALNQYGVLRRYFPDLSQSYLWQQQGMLEYIKTHGKKENVVREALADYGFGNLLSFYRLGKAPFVDFGE